MKRNIKINFSIIFIVLFCSTLTFADKSYAQKTKTPLNHTQNYNKTAQPSLIAQNERIKVDKNSRGVNIKQTRTSNEPNATVNKAVKNNSKAHSSTHAADKGYGNNEHGGEEKFDIKGLIFGHIMDSHDFHLWGDLAVPLPCILYDKQNGLSVFMSSKFDHGHVDYKGYHYDHGALSRPDGLKYWDFSITKNVFAMLLVATLLSILFLSVAKAYRRREGQAPKGVQAFIEPLFMFIRDDIAKENIGEKKYEKFVPYLVAIFFFILGLNLFGLIPIFPGSANVTGNIAVTLVLALITAIVVNASGTKDYWGHLINMPGVPGFVKIVLTPIELLGALIIKPASLMIRLFANITAGHIIILSLVSLIFMFSSDANGVAGKSFGGGLVGSALAVPFVLFMNAIELFVSFLQAYIFTTLSALYIGQAVEEHEHH